MVWYAKSYIIDFLSAGGNKAYCGSKGLKEVRSPGRTIGIARLIRNASVGAAWRPHLHVCPQWVGVSTVGNDN